VSAPEVAAAVDGRIASVTRAFRADGRTQFSLLIPDAAFRPGPNRISLLAVGRAADGALELRRVRLSR
jgi:hypothetical protein